MILSQVNRVAFELFGLPIYWYALIIVSSIILAMYLSSREAQRVGMKADDVYDFMLIGLPLAFVGARIYYIIFDIQPYLADPIQIFNIRAGGLAIYGGLIAGGAWLIYFCYKNYIDIWKFLDIAAPNVLLAQAIGRWGNFMNHEAFGGKTTLDFLQQLHLPKFIIENMYIDGFYRQPTFLYESLWNVTGFTLIILLRKYRTSMFKQGEIALSYCIWYSFGRFFIEGMRTDSLYLFGSIRVSQLLSAILFFGAFAVGYYRRKQNISDYTRSLGSNEFII